MVIYNSMEGRLFKVDDVWRLVNSKNSIIATSDLEYQRAFRCYKLSNDNCEFIYDYDLDEMVVEVETEKQCNCRCHRNSGVMHMMACCNPGSPVFDMNGCLILKVV